MDKKLFTQAIAKFAAGFLLVGLLLFLPAGTLSYWNGWFFMGILFVPMFAAGIIMLHRNPALLRSRLDAREKESEQKTVVLLSGLVFIVGFLLCGLSFRFGWLLLPRWVSLIAGAVFLAVYAVYGEVLRENTYLSRTIGVQEGQKVIDTGLYALVRHPMYSTTVVLFLSMPLVLGSLLSFLVFLTYPFILVKRIRNEEEVLERDLPGYREYKDKVRYRLIPYLW